MKNLLSSLMLASLALLLIPRSAQAQTDMGGYGVAEKQNYDQSSTATPIADPNTPDQFYANISGGSTGSILTNSTLTPPAGRTGTVTFAESGNGVYFQQYFSTQSAMDTAFGPGTYNFTINTSTPNTYSRSSTLPTDDLTSIPIPQLANSNWVSGNLLFDTTKNFTFNWNSSGGGNVGLSIINSSANYNLPGTATSQVVPANTLSINTAYPASLIFNDASNNGYQRQLNFTVGINDLHFLDLIKQTNYDQTSSTSVNLDTQDPYGIISNINNGTTPLVLTSSTVTPPAGATGTVAYQVQASGQGLYFQQGFPTLAALNAAFPAGTYNVTFQTSTPNTYTEQVSFGTANYPAAPQITNVGSNASWNNSTGILQVTDYTKAVTLTWYNPTGAPASFYLENTAVSSNTQLSTTYTIPAGALQNNTVYQGVIDVDNTSNSTATIPNAIGSAAYQSRINFLLQTGTAPVTSKNQYFVQKEHLQVQTSNNAPVDGSGDDDVYSPAPYNISIQSPVSGTVTGPSSTSFGMTYNVYNSNYRYQSTAYANQTSLNAAAPDGTYTFAGAGGSVSLTGDFYPSAAQVVQVNSATPVWDAQGQLALDPTISNTITWSAVTVPNFSTDGHETAEFESAEGGNVDIQEKAGLTTGTTTPFVSITIPAGTMTSAYTYPFDINYGQASTFNSLGSGAYAGALYETVVEMTVVALKPQTITFPTIGQQSVTGTVALNATSSSGLPVTYTVISGPAIISGDTLTFTGPGTVTIQAAQTGNGTYASAGYVTQTFTVTQSTDTPTMPMWGLFALAFLLFATGLWQSMPPAKVPARSRSDDRD